MVYSTCINCGSQFQWEWSEAFYKFGFKDGDGQIETWRVSDILEDAGYTTNVVKWTPHNTIIISIKKNGIEFIQNETSKSYLGYTDPRDYLPYDIIDLLDRTFPPTSKHSFPM